MAYYLVSFHLTQEYFDATPAEQEDLPKQEIEHGKKLFKVGIWKHAYTVPGKVKDHDWGIFQTKDQAELESYLAEYPMAILFKELWGCSTQRDSRGVGFFFDPRLTPHADARAGISKQPYRTGAILVPAI